LAQTPQRTAVDATMAPYAYPSSTSGVQGFNVDLMRAIGRRMGRQVEIGTAPFESLVDQLQAGQIDVIGAPMTVSRERAATMLFTEPYLDSDLQLLVRSDRPPLRSLDDLKGHVMAVVRGSSFEEWARTQVDRVGWRVERFPRQVDATEAVIKGTAEATVTLSTIAAWVAKQNASLALSYRHATGLVWALPVRSDQAALRAELDGALECLKKDGTLATIHEAWFGIRPIPGSAAATVYPGAGVPGMPGYDAAVRASNC
jgi:polar amino acid transport system substrate-binding protein